VLRPKDGLLNTSKGSRGGTHCVALQVGCSCGRSHFWLVAEIGTPFEASFQILSVGVVVVVKSEDIFAAT